MMSAPATPSADAVREILAGYLGRAIAQGILRAALLRAGSSDASLDRDGVTEALVNELRWGLDLFLDDEARRRECIARLGELLPASGARSGLPLARAAVAPAGEPVHARPAMVAPAAAAPAGPASTATPAARPGGEAVRRIEVAIVDENGIVDARTRARTLAASIGFSTIDQYKLATAVSELSRNIFRYAGKGKLSFGPVTSPRPGMFIIARDDGPGIPDVEHVLSDSYVSKTGLGRGLQGCRRIMDEFQIDSAPGRGTTVILMKFLTC